MRNSILLVSTAAALALAGCKGASPPSLDLSCATCAPNPDPNPNPVPVPVPDPTPAPAGTSLTSGDATIALELSKLVSPATGSLSKLTLGVNGDGENTAKIEIDTKSANNALWPAPKEMTEHLAGTEFTGGVGLGGAYKEYRALTSSDTGTPVDEELQVWSWNKSYATQYRDASGGGEAVHQAWSFGGDKTAIAEIPRADTATYAGRFGATAKTSNWLQPPDPDDPQLPKHEIAINNLWRVEGRTEITADFAAKKVTGTLTSERWQAFATDNGGLGFTDVATSANVDPNYKDNPNFYEFMDDPVSLKGTINGNTFAGKAKLPQDYVSGDNPVAGGFFGTDAAEITGAFSVLATVPQPIGGDLPINDDRRGYLQMSGVFHGNKAP